MKLEKIKENWKTISVSVVIVALGATVIWGLSPLLPAENPLEKSGTVEQTIFFTKGTSSYSMQGEVKDVDDKNVTLGIVGDTDKLDFGTAPQNSTVKKIIILDSPNLARARFYKYGNISERVTGPEEVWFKGTKEIKFGFNSTEAENYTGKLVIETLTSRNSFGDSILRLIK